MLLEVGRITKPHGIRGEVMVKLLTDDYPERVAVGAVLATKRGDLVVEASRPHQGDWIVRFGGYVDRNQAETLRNLILSAPPIDDPEAVWVHDLVGCEVRTADGRAHGVVTSVEANPASDLLVLDDGRLVPMNFVVATVAGVVTVDVPRGLLDDDE